MSLRDGDARAIDNHYDDGPPGGMMPQLYECERGHVEIYDRQNESYAWPAEGPECEPCLESGIPDPYMEPCPHIGPGDIIEDTSANETIVGDGWYRNVNHTTYRLRRGALHWHAD